ncbi:MAG TPA: hypothetical protein VIW29_03470 [Polyangiaceae bacterium]
MHVLTHGSGVTSPESQSLRWLVTNGDTTVGPVHTELLLRGYMGGRIPDHCHVREVGWSSWRPLDAIRELGTLKRRLRRDGERPLDLRDACQRLPKATDVGELLTLALHWAVEALDATAGLVHRYRAPLSRPVISAVCGVTPECLGEVLPTTDPSYQLALRGRGLCGSPGAGLAERLIAERLRSVLPLASVAMTPVIAAGRLVALLELGRTGHPFRADDAANLAEFAASVGQRLG